MKFEEKSEDKRNYLKLKSGDTASGIFRGEIFKFRIHWLDKRSAVCQGEGKCDLCSSGNKSKFRFRVNFITKEQDAKDATKHIYVAKIIEQGWNFYEIIRNLNVEYELEKYVMKITRHGEGLNTTHTVIPAPNGLVSDELEKKLALVTLNDLGHITEAEIDAATPESPPLIQDDEIPF